MGKVVRRSSQIPVIETSEDALRLLRQIGAPPLLVQHLRLVAEAATQLVDGLPPNLRSHVNVRQVVIGAALHDAGKILYQNEMTGSGNKHEQAGLDLLLQNGIEPELARFCDTHSDWHQPHITVEDLFVALADTLWKGKRIHELEELAIRRLSALANTEFWDIFDELDTLFQSVAEQADERLERSKVQ